MVTDRESTPRVSRRGLLAFGIALLMLLVAACGGGGDTTQEEGNGAPGTTAATETESVAAAEDLPETVRLGRVITLTYMVSYLAESLGYLDEELGELGVDVKVVPFRSANDAITALVGGEVDFGIQQAPNAIRTRLEGQELLIVASLADSGVGGLVLGNHVETVADLEGKVVGITGFASGAYPYTLAAIRAEGVDPNTVEFLPLGGQAGFIPAIESGEVDALVPGEPLISQLVNQDLGHIAVNYYDADVMEKMLGGPTISTTLMTKSSYAERYPTVTEAMVRAHVRALEWVRDNADTPEVVLEQVADEFEGLEEIFPDLLARVLPSLSEDGTISQEQMETILAFERVLGNVPPGRQVDVSEVFTNEYVN